MVFSEILGVGLRTLDDRIWVMNKASLIIVDGGVGEGKTTLAVKIGDFVNGLHGLPPIVFEEQLALGGEEFAKKLQLCYKKKLPVLIYDEAGDFNRRGSLTRLNALLTRTFETFRAFKVLVIICLPYFGVLDNGLFDKNIPRLLLRCNGRTLKQGNFRAWKLSQMNWIRFHTAKLVNKQDAYNKVYPLYYGHFQNLEAARSRALDSYSVKGKLKALGDAEVRFQGLLTYDDLAKKTFRSLSWVKNSLKTLKIKPKRLYMKRAYFDGGTADRLMDFLDIQK